MTDGRTLSIAAILVNEIIMQEQLVINELTVITRLTDEQINLNISLRFKLGPG